MDFPRLIGHGATLKNAYKPHLPINGAGIEVVDAASLAIRQEAFLRSNR
jgi:hypothetical protein